MKQVIEFPSVGATYRDEDYGVYEYGVWGRGSVLAGQSRRTFIDSLKTLEEAQAKYPKAQWNGENNTGYIEQSMSREPEDWFDPADAGESWDDDY
jgi:hypothetical protein